MGGRKKDFEWRYQPPVGSDRAKLLAYIQNRDIHPSQDKTATILTALTAYYMPLALYSDGSCSRERLELVLLDSARSLAEHFKYTCAALNVDPARASSVLCGGLPISGSDSSPQSDDDAAGLDDFDPQLWNLAGMTTDSETFA